MGIKIIGNIDDILNNFNANIQQSAFNFGVDFLAELGLECMNIARSIPYEVGFEDQTGALRSSIGFAVFYDGQSITSRFEPIQQANNDTATLSKTNEGVETGRRIVQQIGEKTKGLCLVVVAGMKYAIHLESKGRDVLTSAEHYASQHITELARNLIESLVPYEK